MNNKNSTEKNQKNYINKYLISLFITLAFRDLVKAEKSIPYKKDQINSIIMNLLCNFIP